MIDNPFDAMRAAVVEARELNRAVELQANALVDLLDGHLESVSEYRLRKLKAALRRFNARTGKWMAE